MSRMYEMRSRPIIIMEEKIEPHLSFINIMQNASVR